MKLKLTKTGTVKPYKKCPLGKKLCACEYKAPCEHYSPQGKCKLVKVHYAQTPEFNTMFEAIKEID